MKFNRSHPKSHPSKVLYAPLFFLFLLYSNTCIKGQDFSLGNNTLFSLGGAQLLIAGDFNNSGSFNAEHGAFNVDGQLTNSGTMSGGNATFKLSGGNWTNTGTFNSDNGTVEFISTAGNQTLNNTNETTFNNLLINKAAGDITLTNNITVNGLLTISSGDLDLDGNIITLGSNATLNESADATVKGTSGYITVTKDINAPNNLDVAGLGFIITTNENPGTTQIKRSHANQPCNSGQSILRRYEIIPANNSNLNADITFNYDDSELNSLTENRLQLFKSDDDGTSWLNNQGNADNTSNQVSVNGQKTLSMYTLSINSAPVLSNIEAEPTEYTENTQPVTITNSIDLSDIDDLNIDSAIVIITGNYQSDQDILKFENTGLITGIWDETTGTLKLKGNDIKANYITALRSIKYVNTSDNPVTSINPENKKEIIRVINASPRTISFTINDGTDNSNTVTRTVSINGVNDAPAISINTGATVDEGTSVIIDETMLAGGDIDGISLSLRYYVNQNPVHGTLSKTVFTQNEINLHNIIYTHDGSETTEDKFIFRLVDTEGGTSANYTFNISVNPVADPVQQPTDIQYSYDSDGKIILTWQDNSDNENGFEVWRNQINSPKLDIVMEYIRIATLPAGSETFFDENIEEGIDYSYKVTAYVEEESPAPPSGTNDDIIAPAPLNTPTNLHAIANENLSISIEWEDNSQIESGYKIERKSDSDWIVLKDAEANTISYTDPEISPDMKYYYRVKAVNHTIESVYSNECSAECITTDVEETNNSVPVDFILCQNYPNPFNPSTIIQFGLPEAGHVKLTVYNLLGEAVGELINEYKNRGFHNVTFGAHNLNSGIYLYKIESGNYSEIKKMVFMK